MAQRVASTTEDSQEEPAAASSIPSPAAGEISAARDRRVFLLARAVDSFSGRVSAHNKDVKIPLSDFPPVGITHNKDVKIPLSDFPPVGIGRLTAGPLQAYDSSRWSYDLDESYDHLDESGELMMWR